MNFAIVSSLTVPVDQKVDLKLIPVDMPENMHEPSLKPDAGAGVRHSETELANETGPAVENFVAGFFAPGLAVAYNLSLPRGSGVFFDFRYVGPTAPFWGVISDVSFPVTVATSIIDPLPSQLTDMAFGTAGATFSLTDLPSDFGNGAGTPEPGTLGLIGCGFMAIALLYRKRRA